METDAGLRLFIMEDASWKEGNSEVAAHIIHSCQLSRNCPGHSGFLTVVPERSWMTSCPRIISFLAICPTNSAVLSTLSRKFYRYKPHPMYCKRKMYDLLQRRCIRGCGLWVWLPVPEIFLVRLATMIIANLEGGDCKFANNEPICG